MYIFRFSKNHKHFKYTECHNSVDITIMLIYRKKVLYKSYAAKERPLFGNSFRCCSGVTFFRNGQINMFLNGCRILFFCVSYSALNFFPVGGTRYYFFRKHMG